MESRALVLVIFLGTICVAEALRCNYCKKIDKDQPTCDELEEKECTVGQDTCISIKMHAPAYGEVRRCGRAKECEVELPPQVEAHCCSTNLCN